MGTHYKSYRHLKEVDRWRQKITNYYARWFTRHIKALACDKLLLKKVDMNTSSGCGSNYSTFTVRAEKLPVSSAFLGAKQMLDTSATLEQFFDTSNGGDDLIGFTKIEHIYMFVDSKSIDGWTNYRGMLCSSLRRSKPIFQIVELGKDNAELTDALEVSAWLLEKEACSYDLEVELKLEIPFLK